MQCKPNYLSICCCPCLLLYLPGAYQVALLLSGISTSEQPAYKSLDRPLIRSHPIGPKRQPPSDFVQSSPKVPSDLKIITDFAILQCRSLQHAMDLATMTVVPLLEKLQSEALRTAGFNSISVGLKIARIEGPLFEFLSPLGLESVAEPLHIFEEVFVEIRYLAC